MVGSAAVSVMQENYTLDDSLVSIDDVLGKKACGYSSQFSAKNY